MLIVLIATSIIAIFTTMAVAFKKTRHLLNTAFATALFATVCAAFGDTMAVYNPGQLLLWKTVVFISEAVMAPSWLLFTVSFARKGYKETVGRFSKLLLFLSPLFLLLLLIAPYGAFYFSPEFKNEKVLFLDNRGY